MTLILLILVWAACAVMAGRHFLRPTGGYWLAAMGFANAAMFFA
jgi:hypothetical protein